MTTSHNGSLCWECRKAASGLGCCFVDNKPSGATPVPGWIAETKIIRSADTARIYKGKSIYEVYIVKDCPLFEED